MSQQFKILTSCDAPGCFALHTTEHEAFAGDRVPEVSARLVMLPDNWQQVGGKTFCERHKIEIKVIVDGIAIE